MFLNAIAGKEAADDPPPLIDAIHEKAEKSASFANSV